MSWSACLSKSSVDISALRAYEVISGAGGWDADGCIDGKGLSLTEPAVDGRELVDPDEDEGRKRRAAGL